MKNLGCGLYEDEDGNIRRFKDNKLIFQGNPVKNYRK